MTLADRIAVMDHGRLIQVATPAEVYEQPVSRYVADFIGDINLSTIYRLTDVWGIRAGYNLIWIDGLALAPNQYNFGVNEGAGSALVSGGGVFMNGANLGLEARW